MGLAYAKHAIQPDNPTDEQRWRLAQIALEERGRPEDFPYIRDLTLPPEKITQIASPGRLKGCRVGILGGGLAGLAAAFELRKLGCEITVFDALSDRIGGRIYTTFFDAAGRYRAEFGAMRIPVTHETSWHYLKLFNLQTTPFIQSDENTLIYLRDIRVRNDPEGENVRRYIYPKYRLTPREQALSWQQLSGIGFEQPLHDVSPEIRSEIIRVLYRYSPHVLYWDGTMILRLLESAGLSPDAISLVSNFLPLAGQNQYRGYIDYVQEQYSVDLTFLYQIEGGFMNLPNAFYRALLSEHGGEAYSGIPKECLGRVEWKSGTLVTGISLNGDDGLPVVSHRQVNLRNPEHRKFDYLVCALPFSTLRAVDIQPLFGHTKMQAIREVNYIPAQKTALFCRKSFWKDTRFHIPGGASYTDLPISQVWYPTDPGSTAEDPGVLLVYNFNLETTRLANMTPQERFREIRQELERVHGLPAGYLNNIILEYKTVNWNTEPYFRGGLCLYDPEQKRQFSYTTTVPEYNGRVFFAGEHVSGKHRWMQGALQSGMIAANQLAGTYRNH